MYIREQRLEQEILNWKKKKLTVYLSLRGKYRYRIS